MKITVTISSDMAAREFARACTSAGLHRGAQDDESAEMDARQLSLLAHIIHEACVKAELNK